MTGHGRGHGGELDPDVVLFVGGLRDLGERLAAAHDDSADRLADATRAAGADIRAGLESLADAVRLGAVGRIVGDPDWAAADDGPGADTGGTGGDGGGRRGRGRRR